MVTGVVEIGVPAPVFRDMDIVGPAFPGKPSEVRASTERNWPA
jgi:hypothetical protein